MAPQSKFRRILFPANEDIGDLLVSDLIDAGLHGWRSELILDLFQREICT